ncbi:hypothetical protein [Yoonia sp. BS5-3]|uniref:Uncharacterized protein n=1 Tax=Yoonia phaeophyticola TaxID=3137369 RepID=A0ABZ2V9R3_9RHOB
MTDFTPPLSLSFPGNPIWRLLAAHRIPYWWSRAAWIAHFGSHADGGARCVCAAMPDPSILEGLSPLRFGYHPAFVKPDAQVEILRADYALHDDPYQNLHDLQVWLEEKLGPGKPSGETDNLVSRTWQAGPAAIEIRIAPPERNQTLMSRPPYVDDPKLRATCILFIEPGWLPDLSSPMRDLLRQYVPLIVAGKGHAARRQFTKGTHYWPADLPYPGGLGLGSAGPDHIAVLLDGGRVQIIPVADVRQIKLVRLHSARSGMMMVSLHAALGQNDLPVWTELVGQRPEDAEAFENAARDLAARLGLALDIRDEAYPD